MYYGINTPIYSLRKAPTVATISMDIVEDEQAFMDDDMWNAWLQVDGITVAFARYLHIAAVNKDGIENRRAGCWLYDIETREEHRNKGYSKTLLKMIADHYGFDKVNHDGGYTPEGWDFLRKNLDDSKRYYEVTGPQFSSQNFVHDWDAREPRFD